MPRVVEQPLGRHASPERCLRDRRRLLPHGVRMLLGLLAREHQHGAPRRVRRGRPAATREARESLAVELAEAQRGRRIDLGRAMERRLVQCDRLIDAPEGACITRGGDQQPRIRGELREPRERRPEGGRRIGRVLVDAQLPGERLVRLRGRMLRHDLDPRRELAVLEPQALAAREVPLDLRDAARTGEHVRDPAPGREDVVVSAHELHRGALLVDQARHDELPFLEQRDVAIDEPRQRQRERRRLQERDRLGALRVRAVIGDREVVGEREHLVELGEVLGALGGLDLCEQHERLHRRLERCPTSRTCCGASSAARGAGRGRCRPPPGRAATSTSADRGGTPRRRAVLPRSPRAIRRAIASAILARVRSRAVARRQHPQLVERLIAIGVIAQRERCIRPRSPACDARAPPHAAAPTSATTRAMRATPIANKVASLARYSCCMVHDVTPTGIVVQKYGGSSVADAEKIKLVAQRIARTKAAGKKVVVVVSAMGKTTNQLIEKAKSISASPSRRELDMLLTCGEREAMALLSMAVTELGPRGDLVHRLAGRHPDQRSPLRRAHRRGPAVPRSRTSSIAARS